MEAYRLGGVTSLDADLQAARKKVAELESALKQRDKIKVGDYIVARSGVAWTQGVKAGDVAKVIGEYTLDYSIYWRTDCAEPNTMCWRKDSVYKATPAEVDAHLKALASDVRITVEGVTYRAEYLKGYVQFGCAKIDNHILLASSTLMHDRNGCGNGNRALTSVKIGKGDFTIDVLAKLVANLVP